MNRKINAIPLALMLCLPWGGVSMAAADPPAMHFSLPAQSLAESLRAVGSEARITIVFSPELVRGRQAPPLEADLTPAQAVSQLLAGTGFAYKFVNDTTIVVTGGGAANPDPPSRPTSARIPVTQSTPLAPQVQTLHEVIVEGKFISTAGSSAMKMNLPARDTPFSISTYSKSFMNAVEAQQVSSLYPYMTGIQSAGITGYDLVFRGFTSGANDDNSILEDGLPGLPTRFGSPVTIGLERIDVVRGPASVLNGQEEPGGFINLITKKPQAQPFYELAGNWTGYAGHGIGIGDKPGFDVSADATGPIAGSEHFLYRMVADDANRDTFRTYSYDRDVYLAPSITWVISDATKFTVAYQYQHLRYSYDTYLVAPGNTIEPSLSILTRYQQPGDYEEERGSVLSTFFDHRFANGFKWHVSTRDVWHTDDAHGFDVQGFTKNLLQVTRRARGQVNKRGIHSFDTHVLMPFKLAHVRQRMVVGITESRDMLDADRTQFYNAPASGPDSLNLDIYDPDYNNVPPLSSLPLYAPGKGSSLDDRYTVTQEFGAYMADMLTFSRHWKGSVGVRYSRDKQWTEGEATAGSPATPELVKPNQAWLPMGGIVYQPSKHWSLYASYATSYVPPSPSAIDVNGVNSFVPTSATQYEVGTKDNFLRDRVTTTLAVYEIDETNMLAHFKCAAYGTCYSQVGSAKSKGAEFEVNARPLRSWQLTAGVAYTNARITASNVPIQIDSRLPNVPTLAEHLWSRYQLPIPALQGLGWGLGIIHQGERLGDTPTGPGPELTLPAYTRVDTALYYDYNDYSFTFKVQNVFDKTYYTSAGFSGDINLLPGAPRMFTLSARLFLQ